MFAVPKAIEIAEELYVAAKDRRINSLTMLKIIKLLYISHGCKLAVEAKPLFLENVEAWKNGPVIQSVYQHLKHHKYHSIDLDTKNLTKPREENKSLFDFVLDSWGNLTGPQLSDLTHEEGTPWDIAWNELNGKNSLSFVIENNLIRDYYLDYFFSP